MLWLSVNDLWWLWWRYCSTTMSLYVYLRSLVSDLRFISTFCVFISQKLQFLIWTRKCTFLKKGFLTKFSFHVHIYQIKIKMASIVSVVFSPCEMTYLCSLNFLFMKIQGLMFPLSMTVIEGSFIPFHIKSFYCKAGKQLGARCWHHYFPLHLDNVGAFLYSEEIAGDFLPGINLLGGCLVK